MRNATIREAMKELRKQILAKRNLLRRNEIEEKSRIITETVLNSEEYRAADAVFVFMSFGSEVNTRELLERIWRDGKIAAVPKIEETAEGKTMRFYRIEYLAQLVPGTMGILEPMTGCMTGCRPADDLENALILMPGVAFDREGNRLGYGAGFYDRYLAKHTGHPLIAITFSCQITDAVPTEETDKKIPMIITEEEIIRVH